MKRPFFFELCIETLDAARIAQTCGVGRVELCARLNVGGVTPALTLVKAAVDAVNIPVHVLIRPRDGDFVYSIAEFAQMEREISAVKEVGTAGVVLGALKRDGRVDVAGTRRLVEVARPMKVTFHRAFDEIDNQLEALEEVIATGADCLLTSGGAPSVLAGADRIAKLQRQANGRITIMAGGGLTLATLHECIERIGVTVFHGSLQRKDVKPGDSGTDYPSELLIQDITEALRLFDSAAAPSQDGFDAACK
jgi:copper homeostasis protein